MNEVVESHQKDVMNKLRKIALAVLYIVVGSSLLYFSTLTCLNKFEEKFVSAIGEAFLVLGFVEFTLQPYMSNLINRTISIEKKYLDLEGQLKTNLNNIDGFLDTTRKTLSGIEKEYEEFERQALVDKIDFISQDLEITKQYVLEIRDVVINKNSIYEGGSKTE